MSNFPTCESHRLIIDNDGDPIMNKEGCILLQKLSGDELEYFQLTEDIIKTFNLTVNTTASDNVDISAANNKENKEIGIRWTQQQTLLLIRLVESNYEKFNKGLKKNVWLRIAKELTDITTDSFIAEQCDSKWKGLKRTYKSIKDHNNKSGNDRRHWEFFASIDGFLSKKPEVTPISVCDTINNELEIENSDDVASTSSNKTATPAKKRKKISSMEERHKEKMKKQDKFLKILKIAVEHQTGLNISDDSE